MSEDRGCSEGCLEFVECLLRLGVPFELDSLLKQSCDRENDTTVSFDESPVKIGEAKEDLNIVY